MNMEAIGKGFWQDMTCQRSLFLPGRFWNTRGREQKKLARILKEC